MITIIGGGVIGLCSAYFLNKAGHEVQIVEQNGPNDTSGCSSGNAGMIVPSHFMPLAAPGVVRQSLKWLIDSKSPFHIKPRLDFDLFHWLWLFLRSANKKNVDRIGNQLLELNRTSRDLYASIIQEENFKVGYEKRGLMMLYKTNQVQAEEEHLAEKAAKLGLETKVLGSSDVQAMEPDFVMNVNGGVHYLSDAHLDPGRFIKQLTQRLLASGVKIHYNTQCTNIKTSGSKLTHIQTNEGDFESSAVVLASGAWSQRLSKKLNLCLPMQGGKGYSFTIENTPLQLQFPTILCERKIAMTPMGKKLRIAGTMEIAGTNKTVSKSRIDGIKEGVGHYLDNFDSQWLDQKDPWVGLRPVTPDGIPYVGKSNLWDNLFVNTGHAMMGMSLAPVSGKILTDILEGKKSEFDDRILSPDRF